jgi:DNA modification methylase
VKYELFLGDALDFMRGLEVAIVDHIITDPPYDERTHSGAVHYSGMVQIGNNDTGIDEFTALLDPGYLAAEFLRISRRWSLAFCTFEDIKKWRDVAWERKAWVRTGIWDRIRNTPQFSGDRPGQGGEAIAIMHNPSIKKSWNGGG